MTVTLRALLWNGEGTSEEVSLQTFCKKSVTVVTWCSPEECSTFGSGDWKSSIANG